MKYKNFYKEFKNQIEKQYPSAKGLPQPPVSPFIINIKHKTIQEIKAIIKTLYKIAHLKNLSNANKNGTK